MGMRVYWEREKNREDWENRENLEIGYSGKKGKIREIEETSWG